MEWTKDNPNQDILLRSANYLQNINRNLDHLIPISKQSRWCLLFGKNIMYDFATKEEALFMQQNALICLCLVAPIHANVAPIAK